ncbi:hypothetical protein M569_13764 [Genlisea aurea]|uniref:TF-B3 domain-containing protein n=1 Tax=Genlisea aurea TaxID=192259 RepID=S8C9K4_9LAMI|nr:hypothetical protein M569_13764 [Genlisea aurea]
MIILPIPNSTFRLASAVDLRATVAKYEKAEFFKIFLPDRCAQRIQISPVYVKKYSKTVKERIILKDSDGKQWQIEVKKDGGAVYMCNGWPDFIKHYDLKYADMLVFTYDRSYSFNVKVFGSNGCRKDPPTAIDDFDVLSVKSEPL